MWIFWLNLAFKKLRFFIGVNYLAATLCALTFTNCVSSGSETEPPATDGISNWKPPIGIPDPDFGIVESHSMFKDLTYGYSGSAGPYKNAGNGPYTHYVDNTHANATDIDNPFGTPEKPRKSIPGNETIDPGAVIEIHGGPYDLGRFVLTVNGTKEKPVFLRGPSLRNPPVFTGERFYIASQYLIVEYIALDNYPIVVRQFDEGQEVHHVAIRNCDSYNNENSALAAVSYLENSPVHDVVYFNNYLRGAGFDTSATATGFPENDKQGVAVSKQSNRVWVVDNHIHSFPGDGIGAGHAANYTTGDYYIGRNLIHHCAENAIDFKEVENIVISQNVMHSFYGISSGSVGTAAVVHYGPSVSPKNVWFLFNEIYNCTGSAIQVGGDQNYDVHYIGNIIHNIHNSDNSASGYRTWNSKDVYMIGNIFYDVDIAINSQVSAPGARLFLANNIISNVTQNGHHIKMTGASHLANSEISHNLFYQPGGEAKIFWGNTTYSLSEFKNKTEKGEGCIEADPLFTNARANDFLLKPGSPAKDAGIFHPIYKVYEETFGVSIMVDYKGNPRPQGSKWDIGPYEYKDEQS